MASFWHIRGSLTASLLVDEKAADSQIARQILELHARCFCDSESPLITPRVESNLHPTQNPEKKDGGRLAPRSIKISKFSASDFCDESPYIIIIFSGKNTLRCLPYVYSTIANGNESLDLRCHWSIHINMFGAQKKRKIWVYAIG